MALPSEGFLPFTTLTTPMKASTDKKEYKALQLVNGMRVLLISDTSYDLEKLDQEENLEDDGTDSEANSHESGEESDEENEQQSPSTAAKSVSGLKKSAAGLCVGMGSFSDPWELPGLAHF